MMMAAAVTLVTSCGDASGEEGEVTACSCKKDAEALMNEKPADEAAAKKVEADMKALEEKCKDVKPEDCKE